MAICAGGDRRAEAQIAKHRQRVRVLEAEERQEDCHIQTWVKIIMDGVFPNLLWKDLGFRHAFLHETEA